MPYNRTSTFNMGTFGHPTSTRYAPIRASVLSYLDIAAVIALSKTCRDLSGRQTYTTGSLNFISWNKAYRLIYSCGFLRRFQRRVHTPAGCSYETLECRLAPAGPESNHSRTSFGGGGGNYTWVIAVDTTGVRSPGQPDAVLESTTLNLMETTGRGDDVMVDVFHYETQALGVFNYPVLQYPCTLIDLGEGRLKKI